MNRRFKNELCLRLAQDYDNEGNHEIRMTTPVTQVQAIDKPELREAQEHYNQTNPEVITNPITRTPELIIQIRVHHS